MEEIECIFVFRESTSDSIETGTAELEKEDPNLGPIWADPNLILTAAMVGARKHRGGLVRKQTGHGEVVWGSALLGGEGHCPPAAKIVLPEAAHVIYTFTERKGYALGPTGMWRA